LWRIDPLEISKEAKIEKMIVAQMASRLDARKIERERFSSHKRPRGLMISPFRYVLQVEEVLMQELVSKFFGQSF
jgi:hypothetical protein